MLRRKAAARSAGRGRRPKRVSRGAGRGRKRRDRRRSAVEEQEEDAAEGHGHTEASGDRYPGREVGKPPAGEQDDRKQIGPLPKRERDGEEGLRAGRPRP